MHSISRLDSDSRLSIAQFFFRAYVFRTGVVPRSGITFLPSKPGVRRESSPEPLRKPCRPQRDSELPYSDDR